MFLKSKELPEQQPTQCLYYSRVFVRSAQRLGLIFVAITSLQPAMNGFTEAQGDLGPSPPE